MRSAFCLRRNRLKATEKKAASQTVFCVVDVSASALTYMPDCIWQCMLTFTLKKNSLYSYGTWSVSSYLLPASLSLCVCTTFEPARMTRKTIRPSVASGANAFEAFPSPSDESTQANVFLPATTDCQRHEHSISGQPFLGVPVHVWLEFKDAHMLPQHFFWKGAGISDQFKCALQESTERQKNHNRRTGTLRWTVQNCPPSCPPLSGN